MKYVILRPVEPPRICFLKEAVNWCAFGNYPTGYWDYGGKDVREDPEEAEMFSAPIPDDTGELTYLSEAQTRMAGLPPDPSFVALETDDVPLSREYYDTLSQRVIAEEADGGPLTTEFQAERAQAELFWKEYDKWRELHDAYIDQFQTELLLALRKGQLIGHGRKLPRPDRDRTQRLFERLDCYTENIEPEKIPKELWVSTVVDWEESSITTPKSAYVWIAVEVKDLLERFPPNELIASEEISQIGECYAIAERAFAEGKKSNASKRGRPALPWDRFYVEVARLYKEDEMPAKKEAAIQHFQTWFEQELGLNASRTAIGQKLKPFFDQLSEA